VTTVSATDPQKPFSLLLWHFGRRGGGARYTYELARTLMARKDVRVCLAISAQSELAAETLALGLPSLVIDTYQSLPGFAAGFLRLPGIRRQLRDFVKAQKVETAFCTMIHLWNPFLVGALKQGGASNVVVVHDALPHPGEDHGFLRWLMRRDILAADQIVTLSESVRDQLVRHYQVGRERTAVSWHGPFRYGSTSPSGPRRLGKAPHRLLFFGRLLPYKGLDRLVAAMALLQDLPVTLTIAGQGPLEFPALPPNVTLDRRWVAEADIPGLFEGKDLMVLPYQEASQSGAITIAQHVGLPSLVTPVGGLIEQIEGGRTGILASGCEAEDLANSIRNALSDREAYNRVADALAGQSSDRQWDEIGARLIADLKNFKAIGSAAAIG
jgi:glycosyltransferase involved in cell wall biosynthesis